MTILHFHIEPKTAPMEFKAFCKVAPPNSIAIDGFVKGGPKRDLKKNIHNFNHHELVDRLATRCTAAQVIIAMRLGLLENFRNKDGEIEIHVYANDCDQDVCVTIFILMYPHLVLQAMNPKINKLISCEDFLDTTSGVYPYPKDLPLLRQFAYIFQPYTTVRDRGLLHSKDEQLYRQVIEDVCNRIMTYLVGEAKELPINMNYEVVHKEKEWVMVKNVGEYGRLAMNGDGIKAYVLVSERGNGIYQYVIGRMSPYIPFDVPGLFNVLNKLENTTDDRWDGGDIIGGSPRVAGSTISPEEMIGIVNEHGFPKKLIKQK